MGVRSWFRRGGKAGAPAGEAAEQREPEQEEAREAEEGGGADAVGIPKQTAATEAADSEEAGESARP